MTIEYQLDDDVAVIAFNRPDRYNAIDAQLSKDFVDAMRRAWTEARAIVLTGNGKAFCSGADLSGFREEYDRGDPDLAAHLDEEFHPMVSALTESPLPTIAAVNGVAAGAGMGIALGCDLRVMETSAYLTSAFTAIGLAPDSGSTWLLSRHLGLSSALDLTLTNRRLGSAEALQRGLCVEVAEDGQSLEVAVGYGKKLSDLSTDALVTTRKLIRGATAIPFSEALDREKLEQGRLGRTPEHAEGVNAFLEKRKPDFRSPG